MLDFVVKTSGVKGVETSNNLEDLKARRFFSLALENSSGYHKPLRESLCFARSQKLEQ